MRLDLVLIYLANRFWYRLVAFFKNWYWHSLLNLKKIAAGIFWWTDNVPVIKWVSRVIIVAVLVFAYLVWATVPIYLVVRLF